MDLDRYFNDTELSGHLLVQAPGHDQIHDFPLSRGQCLVLPFEDIRMKLTAERLRAARARRLHHVQEQLRFEWLYDEVQRSRAARPS